MVAGIGNFNLDDKSDVVWRHASGTVVVWLMDGTTRLEEGSPGSRDSEWSIVAVADFTGFGVTSILWQHTSGALSRWDVIRTLLWSEAGLGTVPSDWQIE